MFRIIFCNRDSRKIMKLNVFKKIFGTSFIPLFVLVLLASITINEYYERYQDNVKTKNIFYTVQILSEVTGTLQVERGMSVAYLKGADNYEKIKVQRNKVNENISMLTENLPTSVLPVNQIDLIKSSIERIAELRILVDRKTTAANAAMEYTKVIKTFLGFYNTATNFSNNADIISAISGTLLIEMAKEKSGLLRANLAGILAADQPLNSKAVDTITSLRSGMFDNLYSLTLAVSPETQAKIKEANSRIHWQKTQAVFDKVIAKQTEGGFGEDPTQFFGVISKVVNDINEFVKWESADIDVKLDNNLNNSLQMLYILSGTLFTIVVFVIFLSLRISRNITVPLKKASKVMREVAAGNLDHHIDCKSNDEIGHLAQNINDTVSSIQNAFGVKSIEWVDLETMKKNEREALAKAKAEKDAADQAKEEANQVIEQSKIEINKAEELKQEASQEKEQALKQINEAKAATEKAQAEKETAMLEVEAAKTQAASVEEAAKAEREAAEAAIKEAQQVKEEALKNANEAKQEALKAKEQADAASLKAKEDSAAAEEALKTAEIEKQRVIEAQAELDEAVASKNKAEQAILQANEMKQQVENLLSKTEKEANELQDKVKSILEYTEYYSRGDLTRSIEVNSDGPIGAIQEALKGLVNSISSSIGQINTSSVELFHSSQELNKRSEVLFKNSQNTKARCDESTKLTRELSEGFNSVSVSMNELNSAISEISKTTLNAKELTVKAKNMSDFTKEFIQKLAKSSEDIGSVTKLISSIAQQTNLLALNATIEAARAGEAGKGFSVVANEVKELAKQTAVASEEISQKIDAIQSESKEAVNAIGEITLVIEEVNSSSMTISAAAEEQEITASSVLDTVKNNQRVIDSMVANMENLSRSTDDALTAVKDNQASAESLGKLSKLMTETVSVFKLESRYEGEVDNQPADVIMPADEIKAA